MRRAGYFHPTPRHGLLDGGMTMQVLRRLARAAVRYGIKPEDIGPISTFTDEDYMSKYLDNMRRWESPSFYGCTAKYRERAARMG